jgi:hypothetical protein
MKLYKVDIEEINGEQTYTHTQFVYANNLQKASKQAKERLKKWYDDEDVKVDENGCYHFFGGTICCLIESIEPISISNALTMLMTRATIGAVFHFHEIKPGLIEYKGIK